MQNLKFCRQLFNTVHRNVDLEYKNCLELVTKKIYCLFLAMDMSHVLM